MAHPERARVLGARGDTDPEHWEFGGPGDELGGVLMTYAERKDALDERCARHEALLARFGIGLTAQDARLENTGAFTGAFKRKKVALGEFVLGYRDSAGERQRGPFVPSKSSARELPPWSKSRRALDFGSNGSYLVVRKLEDRGLATAETKAALEHAHVERALGPDDAASHRLLRRSRAYGPTGHDTPEPRGLWFMAFNADIRRQFEFVHENYLSGSLDASDEHVGPAPDLSRLMRLRGGGYFFAPGIRALNYLAESAG
jgi:deferrochelatase/peroxidase EfeB